MLVNKNMYLLIFSSLGVVKFFNFIYILLEFCKKMFDDWEQLYDVYHGSDD
jgi:hypothetical protein